MAQWHSGSSFWVSSRPVVFFILGWTVPDTVYLTTNGCRTSERGEFEFLRVQHDLMQRFQVLRSYVCEWDRTTCSTSKFLRNVEIKHYLHTRQHERHKRQITFISWLWRKTVLHITSPKCNFRICEIQWMTHLQTQCATEFEQPAERAWPFRAPVGHDKQWS